MSEMLSRATKYLAIVRSRSTEDKPLNRVYRNMRQPELLQMAYMNLYANKGAMTQGSHPESTIDGMSLDRIQKLSELLQSGRFQWTPSKRVYIPKANGKKRPLGLPNWEDKLVQEAMRLVLTAYYEPKFSKHSHGFRPQRGCHTALKEVQSWTGTKWFIEGDIKACFDQAS